MACQMEKRNQKLCLLVVGVIVLVLVFVVAVFLLLFFLLKPSYQDDLQPWKAFRLPKTLIPYHYEVELKPILSPDELGRFWFYGSSRVDFVAVENTSFILLQTRNLDFLNLTLSSEESQNITRYWIYPKNDYLVVELDQELQLGSNYSLETVYFGELANDLTGFFRGEYVNANGTKTFIAASQMQATFARETFPCFDEPEYKATFDISLWHTKDKFALSNMAVSNRIETDEWVLTSFKTSPRMSTYLLAVVVCDFEFLEAFTTLQPRVQTRVFARPQQIQAGNGNYTLGITPPLLEFYTKLFGTIYPLEKADQIALPDFDVFTAMENWGLITYREKGLLFDSASNSAFSKQEVARVVAHELTHQWFGNLVTPLWWDEIWLNEGFATYVQYLGVDKVEQTWQMNNQFVINDFHRAMAVDGLVTSRPIVAQNVNSLAKIDALFDAISYAKGACLIRMIQQFAGEEAFTLGLKNYLTDNKYGSVTHQQLFEYWEQAINETETGSNPPGGFSEAMNTWVLQMGFPVVNLNRDPKNQSRVMVTQKRFLLDPDANITRPQSPYGYKWRIPFWYKTQSSSEIDLVWMDPDEEDLELTVSENGLIIGNYGVFGYYRVNYDLNDWKRIVRQLHSNYSVIHVKNRAQLIDDSFSLARAGLLPYDIPLNLVHFLRKDCNYISWKSASDVLNYLNKMLARSKSYPGYSRFIVKLVNPCFKRFGWNTYNDHLTQLQQVLTLNLACSFGNPSCKKSAKGVFLQWKKSYGNNTKWISPNFRPLVYCQGVAEGEEEGWNFIWKKYKSETDSLEKAVLLKAWTCVRKRELIEETLNSIKNESIIDKQDGSSVLIYLCENEEAKDAAWDFVVKNWDFIYRTYGSTLLNFKKIIQSCTSSFSTDAELIKLKSFLKSVKDHLGSSWKVFDQAIEQTKANIEWRKNNEKYLSRWF